MSKVLYTAEAHVVGGREAGHGKTSDGRLEVDLRLPSELGGTDTAGTNPEQLFAIGYAACFEGALGAVARRRKVELTDVAIDSKVMLLPTEERGFKLAVELDVSLGGVSEDEAKEIVHDAHYVCPYSNATRGNIEVTLTANGQPVQP
jgi:Ohr subfamily peroxiredoxin